MTSEHPEPVVFRTLTSGPQREGVIALFPRTREGVWGRYCQSFMHVGQHGTAYYKWIVSMSRPATPEEYKELEDELKGRGYVLKVYRRCPRGIRFA